MKSLQEKVAEISRMGITCIKNAQNPYFNSKYADLATVVEALKKPLEDAKIGYLFQTWNVDTGWVIGLEITDLEEYEDKTTIQSVIHLSFPLNPIDPQKMGASITYAKRYLLCTAFNVIAEEDDDGNAASGNEPTLPKKKPVPLKNKTEDLVNDEIPDFFK
jgi:hypothetical protein